MRKLIILLSLLCCVACSNGIPPAATDTPSPSETETIIAPSETAVTPSANTPSATYTYTPSATELPTPTRLSPMSNCKPLPDEHGRLYCWAEVVTDAAVYNASGATGTVLLPPDILLVFLPTESGRCYTSPPDGDNEWVECANLRECVECYDFKNCTGTITQNVQAYTINHQVSAQLAAGQVVPVITVVNCLYRSDGCQTLPEPSVSHSRDGVSTLIFCTPSVRAWCGGWAMLGEFGNHRPGVYVPLSAIDLSCVEN